MNLQDLLFAEQGCNLEGMEDISWQIMGSTEAAEGQLYWGLKITKDGKDAPWQITVMLAGVGPYRTFLLNMTYKQGEGIATPLAKVAHPGNKRSV